MDDSELREHIHDIINKAVSSLGLLSILLKTDLNDKQRELVMKSKQSVDEMVAEVKKMREKVR